MVIKYVTSIGRSQKHPKLILQLMCARGPHAIHSASFIHYKTSLQVAVFCLLSEHVICNAVGAY